MAGLCTAQEQAASSPSDAKATFFDQSHDRLHDIAAALANVDRTAASALLVAKQKVEADLNALTPSPSLEADLTELAIVTHDSLDQLGISTDVCSD